MDLREHLSDIVIARRRQRLEHRGFGGRGLREHAVEQGRHYGAVFGTLSLASGGGAGLGPWVTGLLHDRTGNYVLAFWLAIAASVVSAAAMWLATPRKVRAVAGRVPRLSAAPSG